MDRINIITNTEEKIVFEFKAPLEEANRLRIIFLSEIPSMAVDRVVVRENTSVMTNEYIAHRLGLIPLVADARNFEDNDTFDLTLEAEGKGVLTTVYSGEIKGDYSVSETDIPIVKLGHGQKLSMTMTAVKGIGSRNAKWQVTGAVGYRKLGDELYRLSVESIGMYTAEKILEIGLELLENEK